MSGSNQEKHNDMCLHVNMSNQCSQQCVTMSTCSFVVKKLRRGVLRRAMDRPTWSSSTIQELISTLVAIVFELAARFGVTGLESAVPSTAAPASTDVESPPVAPPVVNQGGKGHRGHRVPFRCEFCCSVCGVPCSRNKPYHNNHRCYQHRNC